MRAHVYDMVDLKFKEFIFKKLSVFLLNRMTFWRMLSLFIKIILIKTEDKRKNINILMLLKYILLLALYRINLSYVNVIILKIELIKFE